MNIICLTSGKSILGRWRKCVLLWGLLIASTVPAGATLFRVTTNSNSGTGSLRQAILNANADTTATAALQHRIEFAIVGTNLALQGYNAFLPMGGQSLVGMFVALAGVRELAPIIAAAMVAAKAGTEMASQIAVMKTRDQLDALEVMAINPMWWLVTPRFLGILLVMPALTVIAIAVTLFTSYLVAVFQLGLNGSEFLNLVWGSTHAFDLVAGLIKGLVFGMVICLVSTFCGFASRRGPEGVGEATNAAVVISSVVCVTLNYFVSQVLYG